jgi:tryptophan synthase alpha chain
MSASANRLDQTFARLQSSHQRAFVAYIAAGDPTLDATVDLVLALEDAGADVIELGMPFSDPVADGIVNQLAADRALRAGATTRKVLETIRVIREKSQIPIVLFTYLNPVYTYGYESFHRDAAAAGADGILILDLPPDEAAQNPETKALSDLHAIRLIAPTTPPDRIPMIAQQAAGFIYYVSREGVTGTQSSVATGISEQVQRIKSHTSVPVCVGFGISTPEQAATVAQMGDGVVVGSAIVNLVEKHGGSPELAREVGAFVKPLVRAVKSA